MCQYDPNQAQIMKYIVYESHWVHVGQNMSKRAMGLNWSNVSTLFKTNLKK